jgi:2-oxo-hept-3-ene-1,7-dioate hydratase
MLDAKSARQIAERLHEAERSRRQIRQLSYSHPELAIDDAYAIQSEWVAIKLGEGRTIRGHKIGLTSRAMQRSSQINEPDTGTLLDDMFFPDAGQIPVQRFIVPRVEVEVAFVLGRPLAGGNCTLSDVLAATDYVLPALEIIDARIEQVDTQTKTTRRVTDTIADNAASAGVVLGGRALRPMELDLRAIPGVLYQNSEVEETGVSIGVLNHPANGIAWLANRLARYGRALSPGEVVLSGSFTRPVAVVAGDTIHAEFGPLGTVSCQFR